MLPRSPHYVGRWPTTYKGRLYLGLRGYDVKSKAHGFIRVELEPAAIVDLTRLLRAHVYGEALEEIA